MNAYCSVCQRPLEGLVYCVTHPLAPVDETPGPPEEPEELVRYAGNPDANPLSMPAPSTERAISSEDFLPTSSEATGRSEFFKAMAFEADKRVKELEAKLAEKQELLSNVEDMAANNKRMAKALGDIQKRAKGWVEQHWAATASGDPVVQTMLAIIADARQGGF